MKSLALSTLLILLLAAACNGTFEIGLEHSPLVTPSPMVLPTDTLFPSIPIAILPSPTPQVLEPTTSPTEEPLVHTVRIFLVAIDDNGQGGQLIGCGDSLIPVDVEIPPTQGVMKAALQALLLLKTQYYGESGLYNALYQADLQVEKITITDGKASVYLTGEMIMGGECDIPRVQAQLEQTVLQFPTVSEADIFINGQSLADVLSLK
jgi:hypothetical protein